MTKSRYLQDTYICHETIFFFLTKSSQKRKKWIISNQNIIVSTLLTTVIITKSILNTVKLNKMTKRYNNCGNHYILIILRLPGYKKSLCWQDKCAHIHTALNLSALTDDNRTQTGYCISDGCKTIFLSAIEKPTPALPYLVRLSADTQCTHVWESTGLRTLSRSLFF